MFAENFKSYHGIEYCRNTKRLGSLYSLCRSILYHLFQNLTDLVMIERSITKVYPIDIIIILTLLDAASENLRKEDPWLHCSPNETNVSEIRTTYFYFTTFKPSNVCFSPFLNAR